MINIVLPKRFKDKLADSQLLEGVVSTTLASFGEILKRTDLEFFKDYTGHSKDHIEAVLAASDNLIKDETLNGVLKDTDIAYLILSVILHDIGMHLSLEGFIILLRGEFNDYKINELDAQTWDELWKEFLVEAKRFSGKQLVKIFGSDNVEVRVPPLDFPNKIDDNDRKLIGEFIRRHHARLAHEIAMNGFPGASIIKFAPELDINARNIIGLIARSHGIALRKCTDYIELHYGKNSKRVPKGIHAPFLMVVLRLADYIQIDSSRTSSILLSIKNISSPFSRLEHYSHLAIDSIDDKYQDDPERIFITAFPNDSVMHLKLKSLLDDIQNEYDISWAVLGEIYGSVRDRPEIKYRRITSNLEESGFISRQEYVADNFSFKANDEITKLLIAPLYGDNPSFGVRELLQNAIDACKEREKISLSSYVGSVSVEVIKIEDEHFFVIKDNGIGMDIEVIKNYFLNAGASFRDSLEWQKKFVGDDGKSTVRRSGRFGVGVLAAFLVGTDIFVETRREGNVGYKFSADLHAEQINIIKDDTLEIGTQIKIRLNSRTLDLLSPKSSKKYSYTIEWYRWFALTSPIVEYKFLGEKIHPYKKLNPDVSDSLPLAWQSFDSEGFNKILWTYNDIDYAKVPFTCNGIVVDSTLGRNVLDLRLIKKVPKVSVFDNNASLPLTLDRNAFSNKLPFEQDLIVDVYKDFIAYLLSFNSFNDVHDSYINLKASQILRYPGLIYSEQDELNYGNIIYHPHRYLFHNLLNTILVSKKGFILNYNYFINILGGVDILLLQTEKFSVDNIKLDIKDRFLLFSRSKVKSIADFVLAIESKSFSNMDARIFMKKDKFDYLFGNYRRTSVGLRSKCKNNNSISDWTIINIDTPPDTVISANFLEDYSSYFNFLREFRVNCPKNNDITLDSLLEKYIGNDVVIPYDFEERKQKYPLAFDELAKNISRHLHNQKLNTKTKDLSFLHLPSQPK